MICNCSERAGILQVFTAGQITDTTILDSEWRKNEGQTDEE